MKNFLFTFYCATLLILAGCNDSSQQNSDINFNPDKLYEFNENSEARWVSFENHSGAKGMGGMENNGAKGHPCDSIAAGASKTILDIEGPGIINRIWVTIIDRSPIMLRSLKIEMYWDGEETPAVSAPFGDFFGIGLGKTTAFQSELFANPEGRSFNCFVPMPFKKSAKIVITNESDKMLDMIFYDINLQLVKNWDDNFLYFHCYWHRDTATTLGEDFEVLPQVQGKGRFIGSNIGLICNKKYKNFWWGEGEVKVYLDGDKAWPTLVGTGTEDYIGTAWGQGKYFLPHSGCLVAGGENDEWAFYRYHITDPVYFKSDCKVAIQQIGGGTKPDVIKLQDNNIELIPITIHEVPVMHHIYTKDSITHLKDPSLPEGWTNFYRSDDVSAAAYFYLNTPKNNLSEIQPVEIRTYNLKEN